MEPVERVMTMAREVREEHANWEMVPYFIHVWRGEWLVAKIVTVEPDKALQVAQMSAVGYSADEIVLVADTYMARQKWMDDRKRLPKPGELQRTFEKGRKDLVTEAIIVHWANRGGGSWMASQPYLQTETGFEWDEVEVVGGPDLTGRIPDGLRRAFQRTEIMDTITEMGVSVSDFGLTPSQARANADCAMTKVLVEQDVDVALFPENEEAMEITRMSFADFDGDFREIRPDGSET